MVSTGAIGRLVRSGLPPDRVVVSVRFPATMHAGDWVDEAGRVGGVVDAGVLVRGADGVGASWARTGRVGALRVVASTSTLLLAILVVLAAWVTGHPWLAGAFALASAAVFGLEVLSLRRARRPLPERAACEQRALRLEQGMALGVVVLPPAAGERVAADARRSFGARRVEVLRPPAG